VSLDDLDPVIHAPKRLAAMAILVNSKTADFGFLRDRLGLSDSDLSKQMSALEKVGYITVTKTSRGRGGTTWYRATMKGAWAFRNHMKALDTIVHQTADQGADRGADLP
jgi:DNA-binding transcriptional ArsR family regulator